MRSLLDLNADLAVNGEDRRVWIEDLRRTWFGDANLDGLFDSADFVRVFQAGQYEDAAQGPSTVVGLLCACGLILARIRPERHVGLEDRMSLAARRAPG